MLKGRLLGGGGGGGEFFWLHMPTGRCGHVSKFFCANNHHQCKICLA